MFSSRCPGRIWHLWRIRPEGANKRKKRLRFSSSYYLKDFSLYSKDREKLSTNKTLPIPILPVTFVPEKTPPYYWMSPQLQLWPGRKPYRHILYRSRTSYTHQSPVRIKPAIAYLFSGSIFQPNINIGNIFRHAFILFIRIRTVCRIGRIIFIISG